LVFYSSTYSSMAPYVFITWWLTRHSYSFNSQSGLQNFGSVNMFQQFSL